MQNFDKFYALQRDQLAAVLAVPDLVIMSPAACDCSGLLVGVWELAGWLFPP
jgi:hypothetical protein